VVVKVISASVKEVWPKVPLAVALSVYVSALNGVEMAIAKTIADVKAKNNFEFKRINTFPFKENSKEALI